MRTSDRHPRGRGPRRAGTRALVQALLVTGLLALAAGCSVGSSSGGSSGSVRNASNTQPAVCQVESVANDVLPSVVTINVTSPDGGGGNGSGEVIKSDGYILTNNHVISAAVGGGSVSVVFSDGATVPATITGRDPQTDLAVLRVEPPHDLKVIAIGSSDAVRVGQPVVALGAPLGLSGTVTSGIVSALDRTIHVPGDNGGQALLVSAIQTDAAINPGNSGGALVNCEGQLVGVPTAGATVPGPSGQPASGGSIGLGFAIPVDFAMSIAQGDHRHRHRHPRQLRPADGADPAVRGRTGRHERRPVRGRRAARRTGRGGRAAGRRRDHERGRPPGHQQLAVRADQPHQQGRRHRADRVHPRRAAAHDDDHAGLNRHAGLAPPAFGNRPCMAKDALASYLNDHLAGSAAALDLLQRMRDANEGNEVGETVADLHEAIKQDRAALETIMQSLDVDVSSLRQAGGRAVEKVSRVKLDEWATGDRDLSLLLETEALALGIEGKMAGWCSLKQLPAGRLDDVDLDGLIGRARQQRATVEELRLAAARAAFA